MVLAAWPIPYFTQTLRFNFPVCLVAIAILYIINLIYLFHLEFGSFQFIDDQLSNIREQYKALRDKYEELSNDFNSLKRKNSQLKSENNYLNEKLVKQRSQTTTVTQNIEQFNVNIVAHDSISKYKGKNGMHQLNSKID